MPSKQGKKRPSRAETRKPPRVTKVPDAINELPGDDMKIAAMTLALNGYQKNSNRRTGAVTHAARLAKVSRQTIHDWLNQPLFMTAIEEATSELIAECFNGYRVGASRGDGKSSTDLLAHLDPALDLIEQRKQRDHEREVELLKLRIQLADKEDPTDLTEPDFSFRETGPGERLADEDIH